MDVRSIKVFLQKKKVIFQGLRLAAAHVKVYILLHLNLQTVHSMVLFK